MTFLQFVLYYFGAKILFEGLIISIVVLKNKYLVYKFKKAINSGQIKLVDLDDITDAERKTWN